MSALLALTDSAVQAVKEIVSSSDEASETGGLRLVAERAGTQANFQLRIVPLPAEDDEVIEEQGARIFLEPEAASLLDDKVLDANEKRTTTNSNGVYSFSALDAGKYKVRQVLPSGWRQTTPKFGYGWSVSLSAGQSATGD